MTNENNSNGSPRPLRKSPTLAPIFSAAESKYREDLDESEAWKRLQTRLLGLEKTATAHRPARGRPWVLAAWAASVAAGVLCCWLGWRSLKPAATAVRTTTSASESALRQATANVSLRLRSGKSKLPDGSEVELSNGAEGNYRSGTRRSTLEFERGRLDIAVAHQTPGHSFVVKAPGYEFVVLGTRFTVNIVGARVKLAVAEGRVAVHDATHTLGVVEKGGHWSNGDVPPPAAIPQPSAIRAAHPAPSATGDRSAAPSRATEDFANCRVLSRSGDSKQAEACYVAVAAGNGLSAEMALYEVARLRRDVLSNPSAALDALDEYEARFASGTLATEIRMARLELFARLGRLDDALHTSNQLLNSAEGRARTVELRLFRGNLLRDKKHDCAGAIVEYRQIEEAQEPRGDQAQFALARCLEQLGRNAEAVQTYQRYLERSNPQQAEKARRKLLELQP